MKISSKSILSPGRAGATRDPPNSLSTSLSRRLRNSGSIKGGASPAMFPITAKKRGTFENPEPSSPKVTCIGQVRVKSKKRQAKKLRTLSRRHSSGEVSFRKLEHPLDGFSSKPQNHHESFNLGSNSTQNHQQNSDQECSPAQRSWVHFPVTICDALRAFGSEFSCLFPCRKEEKMVTMEESNRQGSSGAVFARWLEAVQDGDGGAERNIELVVVEEQEESVFKKPRRHVFEDLEIINDGIEGQQDESRVSICLPPKNALLLMRCRSDPMKMEALTNRSWEPTLDKNEEEDEETAALKEPQENLENEAQNQENDNVEQDEASQDQEHENVLQDEADQDQEHENVQQDEDQENLENEAQNQENVNVEEDEANQDQAHENVQQNEAGQDQDQENVQQDEVAQAQDKELTDEEDERLYLGLIFDENVNQDFEIEEMVNNGVLEKESEVKEERETEKVLPECLLMMMYEPKLSMEVSKETWVCSRDFIKPHSNRRKLPPAQPRAVVQTDGGDQQMVSGPASATVDVMMRVADGGYQPVLQQPARSSLSYPAPPSMATVIEQKLADAVGYEPFVLTRCKSEPMKTAAAKLLPESCVWENRKLERLSRVEFCVGAAGLGF